MKVVVELDGAEAAAGFGTRVTDWLSHPSPRVLP